MRWKDVLISALKAIRGRGKKPIPTPEPPEQEPPPPEPPKPTEYPPAPELIGVDDKKDIFTIKP